MAIKAKVAAALTTRAAAGVAAAALALGGGVVAASAATGNTHPMNWGQQVSEWVEHCKQEVRSDSSGAGRNVGQCVSTFARQNGPARRAEHSPEPKESPSETPDHGQGTDRDQHGRPSPLPAGQPHGQSGQPHGSQNSGHGQPRPSPTVHT